MRFRFLPLLILFFSGIISFSAYGQSEKVYPQSGGYWIGYFGDNKINSRFGIHSEVQARNYGINQSVETFLVRVGLNTYINPNTMLTAGYGYIYGDVTSNDVLASNTSEHRIWQQLILRNRTRNIFLEHRFRLEQRFIENLTSETNQTDHRVRYRFQTIFPLYSIDPYLRHWFVTLNNEIMINLKEEPADFFDRNRFFTGIGYQVSPKMNFQLGYLNQFAQVKGRPKGHTDNLIQFSVSYNMDDLMQTIFNSKTGN